MQICLNCGNTGILSHKVYYLFCDLEDYKFCSCDYGKKLQKQWYLSEKVQKAVKQKRQEQVKKALRFSEIPKKWKEKTLENIEEQENLKLKINQYLDNFKEYKEKGCGIYIWSQGSGRGKTHFLTSICQEIIKRYIIPCIFMTEEQFYAKIRETYDSKSLEEQVIIRKFKEIDCLFLDDLGATKPTLWKNEILCSLLDYRMNNNLPTFFTSNFSPNEYENILKRSQIECPARIVSRIYEICRNNITEVKGEDWRKKLNNTQK